MNIKSFSELTGFSAHTIRYYEKIGLLRHITRDANGHRHFTQSDIAWVSFIKRLKDTGMPLDGILQYADLRESGDNTLEERRKLLEAHAKILEDEIAHQVLHLKKLNEKISYYDNLISNKINP